MKTMITYILLFITILLISMYILPFITLYLKNNNTIEGMTVNGGGEDVAAAQAAEADKVAAAKAEKDKAEADAKKAEDAAAAQAAEAAAAAAAAKAEAEAKAAANKEKNLPIPKNEIDEFVTLVHNNFSSLTKPEISNIIQTQNQLGAVSGLSKIVTKNNALAKVKIENTNRKNMLGTDKTGDTELTAALAAAKGGGEINFAMNKKMKEGEFNPSNKANTTSLTDGSSQLISMMNQSFKTFNNTSTDTSQFDKDTVLQQIYTTLFAAHDALSERIKTNNNRKQNKTLVQSEFHPHHNLDHTLKEQGIIINKLLNEQEKLKTEINKTVNANKDESNESHYINKEKILSCPKKPDMNEYVNKMFGLPTEKKQKNTNNSWIGTGFFSDTHNKTTETFISSPQKQVPIHTNSYSELHYANLF